jgi:hypothetical protein
LLPTALMLVCVSLCDSDACGRLTAGQHGQGPLRSTGHSTTAVIPYRLWRTCMIVDTKFLCWARPAWKHKHSESGQMSQSSGTHTALLLTVDQSKVLQGKIAATCNRPTSNGWALASLQLLTACTV